MAQTPTSIYPGGTPADYSSALDHLASVATGNLNINTHPGLMQALAGANATPQQAQAIDQYMAGVKAQNKMTLARISGVPIDFSDDERAAMDAMGVDYSHSDARQVSATPAGLGAAAGAPSSTPAAPQAAQKPNTGFWSHGILHGLTRIGYDALHNPVTNVMTEGYNLTTSAVAGASDDISSVEQHLGISPLNANDVTAPQTAKYGAATHAQRAEQMTALGYDPNSIWSNLAFDAHGYAKTDIQPAIDQYNQSGAVDKWGISADDAEQMALQLAKDPKKFNESIVGQVTTGDPNTDPAMQKLLFLQSPEFSDFSKRLNAQSQTFGTQTARGLGIDPVKDPTKFAMTAATTDFVASFALDPTMILGKVLNAARKTSITIKSLNDADSMVKLLDPAVQANRLGSRAAVLNGWQGFIDSTNKIREGITAGDGASLAQAAGEYARIQKATPALVDLVPDFIGKTQGVMRGLADDTGAIQLSSDVLKNVEGKPITSLAEAAQYIAENHGLQRLVTGKAVVDSSYMPGAVSNWGWRQFAANRAAHTVTQNLLKSQAADATFLAARNAGRLAPEDQAVYDAAVKAADPGIAVHAINLSKLPARFLPTEEDAIHLDSGMIVAAPDAALIGQHVSDLQAIERQANLAKGAAAQAANRFSAASDAQDLGKMKDAIAQQASALDRHRQALANLADKKNQLASALRAAKDNSPTASTWGDSLLPAEQGKVAYNLRRYGQAVAPDAGTLSAASIGGWSSPSAIAARLRLGQARWHNLMPLNTVMDLNDQATAKKVEQYAKFYLGSGKASQLATQFAGGDIGTRKAIVQGLFDQVAHAAGLSRTTAGKRLLDDRAGTIEVYSHPDSTAWSVQGGNPIALHEGQTISKMTLPSFQDLQKASAKIGLYEGTVGRVATSTAADRLSNLFRTSLLVKPSTAIRNNLEAYTKSVNDGFFGPVARARALTFSSSEQLAKIGEKLGVADLGTVPDDVLAAAKQNLANALETGSKHEVNIAKHTLSRVEKGDLATMSGYGRTRIGSLLSDQLSTMTQFYHQQLLRGMSPEELAHAHELAEVVPNAVHNLGQQLVQDSIASGRHQIRDMVESGLVPQPVTYNLAAGDHPLLAQAAEKAAGGKQLRRTGFALQNTDTTLGQARFMNALHTRTFNSPETTKAVMAYLQDPERDITTVIKALESESKHTAFGQYYKVDESSSEATLATTPEEVAIGKHQWAANLADDFDYLLKNQKGVRNQKLVDYLTEHGTAPDEMWFGQNIDKTDLPAQVLAPEYMATTPTGAPWTLATALQEKTGKVFDLLAEGPMKRHATMPFFSAHYLQARAEQDAAGMLDHLTSTGLSSESADAVLKGQAVRRAYVRTAQMVDDPGQKTQADVIARNILMFPRAMEAFIRRWGGSLAADPFKARKMMLALEASEHSGLVYKDQNGVPTFTYPGSAVMRDLMVGISKLPGFSGIAEFPIGMDMSGKVLASAPGFENPLRFSMSPMINIPLHKVAELFPEQATIWNEVDAALNGQAAVGRDHGILASLTPSYVNNLIGAMSADEKNAAFASAMTGAMAHMDAAGLSPGPNAPDSEVQVYQARLKAQVRNSLYFRFAFGLIAPAAPSRLNENIDNSSAMKGGAGTASDYAFHMQGIQNLSDEYKSILNGTNGDVARAQTIFTALHPEGIAYTVTTTGAGINKAYIPASQESLQWLQHNVGFLKKYQSVGAYFLPKAQGAFDTAAYHAQLSMGIRQVKSLSQFYDDIQIAHASGEYYKQLDAYKNMKAQAIAAGQKAQASDLTAAWTTASAAFLDQNLALKAKFANSSATKVTSEAQIADLRAMVKNGDVPDGLGPQVDQMTSIMDDYLNWKRTVPSTHQGDAQKQAMATEVDQALGNIAASDPRLTNIFNAVFRSIDSSLTKVGP